MAQVPATSYESTSLGDVAEFTIPFPFLSRAEVFVTVDGASVPFTWINDGLVQLTTVPELGAVVRRYRSTAAYVPLHQFSTGVPFLPRYVDRDFKQTLYAVQESVNDTAGTAAQALATAEESLVLVQDAFDILSERTQYIVLGPYGPGLNFQTTSQVFSYLGEFYAPGPALALPYPTTGVGAAEIANFRPVGDATLRADLINSTDLSKGAARVARARQEVRDADTLRTLVGTYDNAPAALTGYYADTPGSGGGNVNWVAGESTPDNGYSVFGSSPAGRWVRTGTAPALDARKLGLRKGTPHTNQAKIQQALDDFAVSQGGTLELPAWIFEIESALRVGNKTTLRGQGAATQIIPAGDYSGVVVEHRGGVVTGRVGLKDFFVHHRDNSGAYSQAAGVAIVGDATFGKIWKTHIENVQTYKSWRGIWLADQAVETSLYNVECGGGLVGETGIYESSDSYDTVAFQLYADSNTGFGMELRGGSGQFFHFHAVANGSDNGLGTVTGGGLNLRTNYNNFFNPHFDRNVGPGLVAGGFGAEGAMVGNKFYGIQSFNNGNGPSQGVTATSANILLGKFKNIEFHGGHIGRIGTPLAARNIRGVVFADVTDLGGVRFLGTNFRGHTGNHLYSAGVVPAGAVSMIAPSFEETVSVLNSNCNGVDITGALGAPSNSYVSLPADVTIVAGAVTATGVDHLRISPEAGALDQLDTITGGITGKRLLIRRNPSATTTVQVTQVGNIALKTVDAGQTYFSLNTTNRVIELVYTEGGKWVEV